MRTYGAVWDVVAEAIGAGDVFAEPAVASALEVVHVHASRLRLVDAFAVPVALVRWSSAVIIVDALRRILVSGIRQTHDLTVDISALQPAVLGVTRLALELRVLAVY
jgi:hypothetical protein